MIQLGILFGPNIQDILPVWFSYYSDQIYKIFCPYDSVIIRTKYTRYFCPYDLVIIRTQYKDISACMIQLLFRPNIQDIPARIIHLFRPNIQDISAILFSYYSDPIYVCPPLRHRVWPVRLYIFFNASCTIFGKKLLKVKRVLIFSTTFVRDISQSKHLSVKEESKHTFRDQ